MPIDRRNTFAEEFSYRASKDGAVFIAYGGKQVTILRGRSAASALRRLERSEGDALQLEAKLAGNFRRGNERSSKRSRTWRCSLPLDIRRGFPFTPYRV